MAHTRGVGRRVRPLDGIRAIAILGVIAFHVGVPGLGNGAAGVIVFFVLSGYLITTLLIAAPSNRRGLGLFYLRRVLRLVPALVVLLLSCAAYAFLVLSGQQRSALLHEIVSSGTYLQDFALSSRPVITDWGYLGHTWSLAVEEQFYILWPLVLLVLQALRTSRRTALVTTLTLTVAAISWRSYLSMAGLHHHVGEGLDGNAESLLVGCSLALLLAGCRPPSARIARTWSLLAALALLLLLVVYTGTVDLPFDMARLLAGLLTAVVITGVILEPENRTARFLAWAPLTYIGLLSYGLYLWHPVVFRVFEDHVHVSTLREKAMWAPAMLGVTALITIGSYYLVEKPFNGLKDRLPGGRRLSVRPDGSMSHGVVAADPVPETPNGGLSHRKSPAAAQETRSVRSREPAEDPHVPRRPPQAQKSVPEAS
jgi:peptidoglycan/LPS O-acetylase OafA/YrhL